MLEGSFSEETFILVRGIPLSIKSVYLGTLYVRLSWT